MITKGENQRQCSEKVSDPGRWGSFHQHHCRKLAVVECDGKWYCQIHDPEYVKRKADEYKKEWDKKNTLRMAEIIARQSCQKINPEHPEAVVEAIVPMYEALKVILTAIPPHWLDFQAARRLGITMKQLQNAKEALALAEKG